MSPLERWTIGRLLETAAGYLKGKGSSSPRLDAELLLADVLALERIELYTQHERPLTPDEVAAYRALIARRAGHEPVAYILGRAYFRHLSLRVGPGVLVPRPETEELVELALQTIRIRPLWEDLPVGKAQAPVVADVGTGSGAIALCIAQEAGARVLAVDDSPEALAMAEANARSAGLSDRLTFRRGDLLIGLPPGSLALVISNPPYVRSGDMAGLAPDIRLFEPPGALDGGPDGLLVYRRLVPEAARALRPGGTLLLEVGQDQAAAVGALAGEAGFALVSVHRDLSRKERMVEATLPGAPVLAIDRVGQTEARALQVALNAGALIGLPTDTVYGLAARWDLNAGVRRLFAAKRRRPKQPVAVLFPSVEAVRAALPDLDPRAARVLAELLPGPYTFVVGTTVPRPEFVGTPDSLGVRVPDHPGLLRLLAAVGVPLAATSANLSGFPEAASAEQTDPEVLAHCSLALTDAPGSGPAAVGVASTVVDLRPLAGGGEAVVLREGAVLAEEVSARIRVCATGASGMLGSAFSEEEAKPID